MNTLESLINNYNKAGDLLIGTCPIDNLLLQEHHDNIKQILPVARSLVVVIASHSMGALSSSNIQIKQYDTIYTYERAKNVSMDLTRKLEAEGYTSAAVPSFIPLDLLGEKKGMRGEICWRIAGIAAGLGKLGKNNLLKTEPFGSRIRIGGLLTSHPPLKSSLNSNNTEILKHPSCDNCNKCKENCPTGALDNYSTDKKKCGDHIFAYGLRKYIHQTEQIINADQEQRSQLLRDGATRELWQNFMTGCYYYCWECQNSCPLNN